MIDAPEIPTTPLKQARMKPCCLAIKAPLSLGERDGVRADLIGPMGPMGPFDPMSPLRFIAASGTDRARRVRP